MPQFTVPGYDEPFDLVVQGLTFGEARAVEKVSGVSFQKIMDNPDLRGDLGVLQSLIWVSMKRRNPTLTFKELDDIEIDSIEWPSLAGADETDEGDGDAADPFDGSPVAPEPQESQTA